MRKSHCDLLTITVENNIIYTDRILKIGGVIIQEKKARVYFRSGRIARIHNLGNPCPDGEYITEGNYIDFDTYGDAIAEIEHRNKIPQDCKKCNKKGGWIKD